MQVFQRGVNESLMIGANVVVTVLEITPHCVRIAVENPDATPSYREEVLYLDQYGLDCDQTEGVASDANESVELALSGPRYLGW